MKIPLNIWEHQNAIKALYGNCMGPVCQEHSITRMDLNILLFLANNPRFDTARDMVEIRYLSKSQVSASVNQLEKNGYLRKYYAQDNRKTAHLLLCDKADPIIQDGRKAQEQFFAVMTEGIPTEELACMERCMTQMWENIDRHMKEETR